jgi:apolipoprotein N-acyltransferase
MDANSSTDSHRTAVAGLGLSWSARLTPWLALLGGALTPLSLAPLNLWPLAFVGPALLALLLYGQSPRQCARLAFFFGLGLFGVGASWVYVSIHDFGQASITLAILLTALFVAGLALVFALPLAIVNLSRERHFGAYLLRFGALWVLGEWLRSWLLTGFPWLFIGYSQMATPLAGWAPVAGVFGVSLITVLTAIALAFCCSQHTRRSAKLMLTAAVAGLWLTGGILQNNQWTTEQGEPVRVALVQANIPQEKKWQPSFLLPTLERYRQLSRTAWSNDWVIWPEAAIPMLYHRALPFLEEMQEKAANTQTALITGILYDTPSNPVYHNSAVGLGMATGMYHKTRLVPFGEYVPLEQWLRGLIEFFNLPTSIISSGDSQQHGLQIGSLMLATAICYEIVYPDLVAEQSRDRSVILTISNDAWFGHSWGPLQHLQMAQMRALETGRYVIRGTNNGVSAIISPDGSLQQASDQFVQAVVEGEVQPRLGDTPFMSTGSLPTLLVCALMLAAGFRRPLAPRH